MPRQSAPKAAQSDFNPRILMAKVMNENKTAGKDACLVRFEKLLGGPFTGYLHETVLYTARLLYDYVLAEEQKDRAENDPRPNPPARSAEEIAAKRERIARRDADIIARTEQRIRMKLASDMTHDEGWHKGGVLRKLCKKGSKQKIWSTIGEALKAEGIEEETVVR